MRPSASSKLRVIGGKFRGRRLHTLAGAATRPMLGRLRQRLFDMLQGQVEGAVFADLYAGTGAVGIEALSRGARRAVFVEESPFAARVIRRNLEMLGLAKRAHVRRTAVRRVIGRLDAEMYFLGPPYDAHGEYRRTLEALSRCELAVAIAQHSRSLDLGRRYGRLERARLVISGRNRISIFRPRADP